MNWLYYITNQGPNTSRNYSTKRMIKRLHLDVVCICNTLWNNIGCMFNRSLTEDYYVQTKLISFTIYNIISDYTVSCNKYKYWKINMINNVTDLTVRGHTSQVLFKLKLAFTCNTILYQLDHNHNCQPYEAHRDIVSTNESMYQYLSKQWLLLVRQVRMDNFCWSISIH